MDLGQLIAALLVPPVHPALVALGLAMLVPVGLGLTCTALALLDLATRRRDATA